MLKRNDKWYEFEGRFIMIRFNDDNKIINGKMSRKIQKCYSYEYE